MDAGVEDCIPQNKKKSSYVAHTKEVVLRGAHKKKSSDVAHTKRSRPTWHTQKKSSNVAYKKSSDEAYKI